MASNNKSRTPSRKKTNENKTCKQYQEMVLNQVNEMFDSILEPDVIMSVVQNCDWKLQPSIDALIGLSANAEVPGKQQNPAPFEFIPNTQVDYSEMQKDATLDEEISFLKINDTELQQQREELKKFEQLKKNLSQYQLGASPDNYSQVMKDKSSFDSSNRPTKMMWMSASEATSNAEESGSILKVIQNFDSSKARRGDDFISQRNTNKSPEFGKENKNASFSEQSSKPSNLKAKESASKYPEQNVNQTESRGTKKNATYYKGEMCGLKVEYRSHDMQNSSDDDADVVIENEEDCAAEIPALAPVNVCQFLSSMTQSPPQSTRPVTSMIQTSSPPNSPERNVMNRIEENIRQGFKVLIILRGLPGSGKSYLARNIVLRTIGPCESSEFIFSTDDFFVTPDKGYNFVAMKLDEAHRWNKNRVSRAVQSGLSPIIVDNTNSRFWETMPYVNFAVNSGYYLEILEPKTAWSWNLNELTRRNVHGVPKLQIQRMLDRYERNITGYKLMQRFNVHYAPNNYPPQMRSYPSLQARENEDNSKTKTTRGRDKKTKKNVEKCEVTDEITKEYNSITEANKFKEWKDGSMMKLIVDDWKEGEEEKNLSKPQDYAENVFDDSHKYKVSKNHNQTLGAIGSERKSAHDEERVRSQNGLTHCWDFTLLLDGHHIHSVENPDTFGDTTGAVQLFQAADDLKNKVFVSRGSVNFLVDAYDVQNLFTSENEETVVSKENVFETRIVSDSPTQQAVIVDTLTDKLPDSTASREPSASCSRETLFSFYSDEVSEDSKDSLSQKLASSKNSSESKNMSVETRVLDLEDLFEKNSPSENLDSSFQPCQDFKDESEPENVPKASENKKNILTTVNALNQESEDVTFADDSHLDYVLKKLISSTTKAEDEIDKKNQEAVDNISQISWRESPFPVSDVSLPKKMEESKKVQSAEASTNTCAYDFKVTRMGGKSEPQYKIMRAFNRSINENFVPVNLDIPPKTKLMLHKSSMTDDLNIYYEGSESNEDDGNNFKDRTDELAEMFPLIPREYISDVYKNVYDHDFNWAVDCLLEGVPEDITKYHNMNSPKLDFVNTISPGPKKNDNKKSMQAQAATNRKKEKNHVSEEVLALQRHLEEKVKVKEASYHPHILRVKRWKNRETDITNDEVEAQVAQKDALEFASGGWNNEALMGTSSSTVAEFMNEGEEEDVKEEENSQEAEEMIEFNLGKEFIGILEKEFGNPQFEFPDGLLPVVQIRKSMAQELHTLWIESMQQQLNTQKQQLDTMISKDAEYAKMLEAEEARSINESKPPNLTEIMDMEMALAIYNNDLKQKIKQETPNDMASRLTRQLLHESFPHLEPDMLNEILNAHNGNFKETIEVLETNVGQNFTKKNAMDKQQSLIDKVKQENIEFDREKTSTSSSSPVIVVNSNPSHKNDRLNYDHTLKIAEESRQEALRQYSLRRENYNKALEAMQKRSPEVAAYYFEMAKLHEKNMKYAHLTAASAYVSLQAYNFDDGGTLDLHYLYVPEALEALDVFLDQQMEVLRNGNKNYIDLYIITGRGTRSHNGQSKIKPAVTKKLTSKNIRYSEANPGCLKITLRKKDYI